MVNLELSCFPLRSSQSGPAEPATPVALPIHELQLQVYMQHELTTEQPYLYYS